MEKDTVGHGWRLQLAVVFETIKNFVLCSNIHQKPIFTEPVYT